MTERKCCAGLTISKASQPPRSARSPVARIDGLSGTPLRKRLFSWRVVDRLDDLGLARPEQHLLAPRPPRPGPAPCPRRRRRRLRAFMPSPPRRAPFRPRDRAASAPAPARRARRSARPRSAAPRPRRSSPHCRCTATKAARRRADRGRRASAVSARADRLVGRDAAGDDQGGRAGRRRDRAPRCGRPGNRPPPAGRRRRYRRRHRSPLSLGAQHRALQAGEGEMRLVRCRPAAAAAAPRAGSPASAARSTAGPPGKPRPSSFAVLSNASPAASSIVVARRR